MYYRGTHAAHPLLGQHGWRERYQAYTLSHGRGERKEEGRTIMIMGKNERIGHGRILVSRRRKRKGKGKGKGKIGRGESVTYACQRKSML